MIQHHQVVATKANQPTKQQPDARDFVEASQATSEYSGCVPVDARLAGGRTFFATALLLSFLKSSSNQRAASVLPCFLSNRLSMRVATSSYCNGITWAPTSELTDRPTDPPTNRPMKWQQVV